MCWVVLNICHILGTPCISNEKCTVTLCALERDVFPRRQVPSLTVRMPNIRYFSLYLTSHYRTKFGTEAESLDPEELSIRGRTVRILKILAFEWWLDVYVNKKSLYLHYTYKCLFIFYVLFIIWKTCFRLWFWSGDCIKILMNFMNVSFHCESASSSTELRLPRWFRTDKDAGHRIVWPRDAGTA